ncbi:MAG: hypothetical protein IJC25_05520, partial [Clostridia bacterium]|nr:hypothetical protein [Clostridia bacterium]
FDAAAVCTHDTPSVSGVISKYYTIFFPSLQLCAAILSRLICFCTARSARVISKAAQASCP